jgi:ABC-type nitrate/sulfonate/bicarbonate transport system permease component
MTRRLGLLLLELVVPASILVAFGLWSAQAGNFFFPPLTEIARVFGDTWIFDRVGSDVVPSLLRLLAGYGLAVVLGVGLGTALGLSRTARTAADPVVQFLRALPAPAVIPFALLVLGTGDDAKVFVIVLGTIWPILLNTVDGVRGVEQEQLDVARSYQIPPMARLRHIVLPAASPRIFAGMRTSLAIGIVLMVVSEMVASRNGIGYFTLQAQRSFAIPEMWSGIVLLGLLGFALNWVFLRIEDRVLFWHRGARGLPGGPDQRGPGKDGPGKDASRAAGASEPAADATASEVSRA